MPPESQLQAAKDYVAKLLPVGVARELFCMSQSTFLRFRHRHKIALLPGRRVHISDVMAALERDRRLPR